MRQSAARRLFEEARFNARDARVNLTNEGIKNGKKQHGSPPTAVAGGERCAVSGERSGVRRARQLQPPPQRTLLSALFISGVAAYECDSLRS